MCEDGVCIGIEDKCMRYGVQCESLNPCLEPLLRMTYDGNITNCDPGSGSCMFKPLPDSTPCSSYGSPPCVEGSVCVDGGPIDGRCVDGMCIKIYYDKCIARAACPDIGQCYLPSTCDNFTGDCISVFKTDGTPCDDGRSNTYRDICIEGRCIGDPYREPTFQTMGQGDCIQQPDVSMDYTPIQRYYVDAFDETICQKQCRNDPECYAFSYGYHSCGIYGTSRQEHPDAAVWGDPWVVELARSQVHHTVTCWKKTEGETWSFQEFVRPYLFPMTVFVMLCIPIMFTVFVARPTVKRSWRRINGLPDEDEDEGMGSWSPRGAARITQGLADLGFKGGRRSNCTDESGGGLSGRTAIEKLRPQKAVADSSDFGQAPPSSGDDTSGPAASEEVRLGPSRPGDPAASTDEPASDPRGEVHHAKND